MIRILTLLMVAMLGVNGALRAQIGISIAVSGGNNQTCQGRNVTFSSSTINAGTLPNFQWFVNGIPAPGAVGGSFTTNALMNGDQVTAQVQRSFTPFDSAMSNTITMIVVPNITPTVTKAITQGSNPGCTGVPIQFTATATNAGLNPTYRWYLNGTAVSTNQTYTNNTAVTGALIWVRVLASGAPPACYTTDTAYSDTTSLVRLPVPATPVISFIGKYLVSDSGNVQWYGPAGILPGAFGPSFMPTVQGEYYALINNPLCGTGKSNVLIVSPLDVASYNLEGVKVFPNPTTGLLNISWNVTTTARISVLTPSGQVVLQDIASGVSSKSIDLSRLSAGLYFVMLQDEQGQRGVVRVMVGR